MYSATQYATHVEALLTLPFLIMGLSHILQPKMWRDYFTQLAQHGHPAIVTRTFTMELWPAILIVTFHQVWSGPALLLTLYGHLLLLKVTSAILFPQIGLRSLAMAETHGDAGLRKAGVMLLVLGALCAWQVTQTPNTLAM